MFLKKVSGYLKGSFHLNEIDNPQENWEEQTYNPWEVSFVGSLSLCCIMLAGWLASVPIGVYMCTTIFNKVDENYKDETSNYQQLYKKSRCTSFWYLFFPTLKSLDKKKHTAPHNLEQCIYGLFLAGLIDVTMMLWGTQHSVKMTVCFFVWVVNKVGYCEYATRPSIIQWLQQMSSSVPLERITYILKGKEEEFKHIW